MKGAQQKQHEREQRVNLQILKQITYPQFMLGDVIAQPDGSRIIQFVLPNGEVHLFPLAGEAAQKLGQQLLAPSVEVPSPGAVPPQGNGLL